MEVEIQEVQVGVIMSIPLLFLLRLTIAVLGWRLRISTFKVVMNFAEASSMQMEEVNLSLQSSETGGALIIEEFAVLMKVLILPVTVTIG
jgi:hypothetical protein